MKKKILGIFLATTLVNIIFFYFAIFLLGLVELLDESLRTAETYYIVLLLVFGIIDTVIMSLYFKNALIFMLEGAVVAVYTGFIGMIVVYWKKIPVENIWNFFLTFPIQGIQIIRFMGLFVFLLLYFILLLSFKIIILFIAPTETKIDAK